MTDAQRMLEDDRGWPFRRPEEEGDGAAAVLRRLRSGGAVRWYLGAMISIFWLLKPGHAVIESASSPVSAVIGIVLIVAFGIAFLASAPLQWGLPAVGRLLVSAALMLLSLTLIPWLGLEASATWTYVGVSVGMATLRWAVTWPIVAALGLVSLFLEVASVGWTEDALWLPAIIVSISFAMAGFAQTQATITRLRATQRQVESLAAERERGRMARDIHDILGHSLTVVTVKSELAGRLVDIDPARAKTEMAEVEALARGALADVRSTVAGVHEVNISGELAAARAALAAADIDADLPSSTDAVGSSHRELAGWIVREGVTNVLRHAEASVCRVRLDTHMIEISDDGVGPSSHGNPSSTGLAGLRERVESAGGRMAVGRSDLGGFNLKVTL